ncbi:hypothetical protein C8Q75DRAFT_806262 [Abortiporus biennis]|nr:hypothetical protein C8Q75DRAFT_806262 [Abortiporus biennis]
MAGNLLPHGWDPTSIWLESYFHKPKPRPLCTFIYSGGSHPPFSLALGHGGYALADVVSESGAALELRISGSEGSARERVASVSSVSSSDIFKRFQKGTSTLEDVACIYQHALKSTIIESSSTEGLIANLDGIETLNEYYKALVEDIFLKATTASYALVLEGWNGLLTNLDVIVSFAHVRVTVHAPEAYLNLPTIFDSIQAGPHMGGNVGITTLLVQIGSFVPCLETQVPIFDSVLCSIGADRSQLRGISTFMAEMLETGSTMRTATRDS